MKAMRRGLLAASLITAHLLAIAHAEDLATATWKGSNVGRTDRVLAPWTPIEVEGDTVSCWGRKYKWGELPLPEQITTQGSPVLLSPIRLTATVAGQKVAWRQVDGDSASLLSSTAAAATIQKAVVGSGIKVTGTALVEFDGMMRIELAIDASDADVTVDSLWIEIPYAPTWATLYHYWPPRPGETGFGNSGAVGQDKISSIFRPLWWLGNEDGGLCWFAESDEGWEPAQAESAIEILPSTQEVTLRLRLWDVPRVIRHGKTEKYTMGLQATPVKPWPRDWHRQFYNGNLWYHVQPEETWQKEGRLVDASWFDAQKEQGVTLVTWGDWCPIQAYTKPHWPERFREMIGEAHQRGMKIIPYFGFEMSDAAPEWPKYSDECRVFPSTHQFHLDSAYSDTMPEQSSYAICYRSHWADFIIDGIARLKQEYGIDGVYLDGTASPWACFNEKHGCGYTAKDGSRRVTYPIFAVRDLMKRIWTLFGQDGGVVMAHNSSCIMPPTLAFATCYMDPEHMCNMTPKSHPLEMLSLATFRAELMGRNLGVPSLLIDADSKTMTSEQFMALSLLHGAIPRSTLSLPSTRRVGVYHKIFRDFDADNARWLPYWNNARYLSTSPSPDVYGSLFVNADTKQVLLLAANLGRSELASASVAIDFDALGLPELRHGRGLIWAYGDDPGREIPIQDGKISLTLPVVSPRVILVHANTR